MPRAAPLEYRDLSNDLEQGGHRGGLLGGGSRRRPGVYLVRGRSTEWLKPDDPGSVGVTVGVATQDLA